jgi:ADP-heptose:LPS heptosyltransferase
MRIAVIKLGALGDFVQALSPFRTIRAHHERAHITLITTNPFASLGRASGYFDEIWEDGRPRTVAAYCAFIRRLRRARFDRVYDLQTSTRSNVYFLLLFPRFPEWSGVALGCSHPHANPNRVAMHTVDRQAEQLAMAGLQNMLPADLSWAKADVSRFALPKPYVLLVPGGSAHRPRKRWPATRYGALAQALVRAGSKPVVLGSREERGLAQTIKKLCPQAIDLVGQSDLLEVVALSREAALAVGNDTGPMHLIAASGTPSLVLFSDESDPARCAPRGRRVRLLSSPNLADLSVERVLAEVEALKGMGHE